MIEYAPSLPPEFRDSRLLPNLLALAAEDAEEQRMTAAKLLGAQREREMGDQSRTVAAPLGTPAFSHCTCTRMRKRGASAPFPPPVPAPSHCSVHRHARPCFTAALYTGLYAGGRGGGVPGGAGGGARVGLPPVRDARHRRHVPVRASRPALDSVRFTPTITPLHPPCTPRAPQFVMLS